MTTSETNADELRETVRRHYAGSALAVMEATGSGGGPCCGGESAGSQVLASEGGAAFYDALQREVLASTCSCPPGGSGPPARLMGST
jgi:hypothetical protein